MSTVIRDTRTLQVQVTDADLRDPVPGDPCNCPIALAVRRAAQAAGMVLIDAAAVVCDYEHISITCRGRERWLGQLPQIAIDAMAEIDRYLWRTVHPFRFDLTLELR